jgi:uncharacterized protein (DUF488 family)
MNSRANGNALYSIGHSNHALDVFLGLLANHCIDVLVDVRSQPYSAYTSYFNAQPLRQTLTRAGIEYLFLGAELGGRPGGDEFYDAEGHVLYDRLAASSLFLQGIERLQQLLADGRVAMMCSEENPAVCHRHLLVGRVLAQREVIIQHIRGDGRLQTDAELLAEQSTAEGSRQRLLFAELEEPPWRSLRSVSPRRPQPSSLEP